jgi:hypothetical protein
MRNIQVKNSTKFILPIPKSAGCFGEREFSQSFHIFDFGLRRFFRVGATYRQFVCPLPNCLSQITSQTRGSFLQVFVGKRFPDESFATSKFWRLDFSA